MKQIRKNNIIAFVAAAALSWAWPSSSPQAGLFGPSNFWDCILEEMPDAQNDQTAREVHAQCESEFPDMDNYERETWAITGPDTAEDCTSEYTTKTRSVYGRILIRQACYRFYPKGGKP